MELIKSKWKLGLGQQLAAWQEFIDRWSALRSEQKASPILVSGAYRSGTTWVGKMLAGKGIWHLHEPFNPRRGLWDHNFSYRRSSEPDPQLDMVVNSLLSGQIIGGPGQQLIDGIRTNLRGMPARLGLYRRAISRILIKDPIACLLSDYLVRNHDFIAVLVLRHPAGFVGSLKKLRWDTAEQLRNLRADQTLVDDWFLGFERVIERASTSVDISSHATLYACLWRVLEGFARLNHGRFIIADYERLCEDPEKEFGAMFKTLELQLHPEDKERHRALTEGTRLHGNHSAFDVARKTSACRRSWASALSKNELHTIRKVWTNFDLPFFQNDRDW